MGRRLGIIVGINSYQDTAFQPLQYAETDARALAQWLVNTKGGNWTPSDVQMVQGTHATRELVESMITQMCVYMAQPDDLVFVYFAGHTFLDERSGEGYLAFANTYYQQPTTGLHFSSLAQQAMGQSRASTIVFLLDCFQTGRRWSMYRSSPYDIKPLFGPAVLSAVQQCSGRILLGSCRGNEVAPEAGEKRLGIFAYHTIMALCGPASDPNTHQITLQHLQAYLFKAVGEQQRPQLFGQARNPVVLVGEMPSLNTPQASGPLPPQRNSPLSSAHSEPLPPTLSRGFTSPSAEQAFPATTASLMTQERSSATATAQMSPTTSGQLALSANEQQCEMLLRQARHLVQMQNPGEAFNLAEKVLQISPTNTSALILKGQLLGTVGRFSEAQLAIEQVLQLEPNNALAWSMRAAVLTNTRQYQLALQAVERSLELNPNNPETYAIKTSITGQLAMTQQREDSKKSAPAQKRGGPASFFIGLGIAFVGLILGVTGSALLILQPNLPVAIAFGLQSTGLALLCVNAARGSFVHGFGRFFLTLFMSALTAAILGGVYVLGQGRLTLMVKGNPPMLIPVLLLGLWLALAAAVPFLLALIGLIAGFVMRIARQKQ
jgi:tetratricopeptide (TPR) repeat protein